jgi:hypothetical protein
VIRGGHWTATLAALSVVGVVAGCSPATTSPATATTTVSPSSSSVPPSAIAMPTATPGLSAEMEIGSLDPALTDSIYEFASDGESILFSSGLAEDAGRGASPDLWRYRVYADDPPELLWRNPERNDAIVKIAGDNGTVAFVDIPRDGARAWDLRLIPRNEDEAILLDTHPGDEDVPSLVPSFSVQESMIVWTAFDREADRPVSQLLLARGPEWKPTLLRERPAADAELWFPSLHGGRVAFCEIVYSADGTSDARNVYLLDLSSPDTKPQRLSHSDLATMPVLVDDSVIWKEADPGFSMFNWGRLWRYDIGGPGPTRLGSEPFEYVNYPSAGSRFVAWWANDAFLFGVYDLLQERTRVIERYTAASGADVLRPHISGDVLVWLYVEGEGLEGHAELRYAVMPPVRAPP